MLPDEQRRRGVAAVGSSPPTTLAAGSQAGTQRNQCDVQFELHWEELPVAPEQVLTPPPGVCSFINIVPVGRRL